jgi:hypothetical protein
VGVLSTLSAALPPGATIKFSHVQNQPIRRGINRQPIDLIGQQNT